MLFEYEVIQNVEPIEEGETYHQEKCRGVVYGDTIGAAADALHDSYYRDELEAITYLAPVDQWNDHCPVYEFIDNPDLDWDSRHWAVKAKKAR